MDWTKPLGGFLAAGIVFAAVSFVGVPTLAGTAVANQSALEVNSVSISENTLEEGGSTAITAEVENTGVFSDAFSVQLEVDGSTVQSKNVFISGYSSTEVTFQESFSTPGEYSISVNGVSGGTVTVLEPASFEVTDAALADSEIVEGGSVETTATVENSGDLEGTYEAELEIDGQTVDSQSVTLDGGESTTVSFDRSFSDAGSYDVSVSGETADTLEVLTPPDIEATTVEATPNPVLEGEAVSIQATLENSGGATGEFEAELQVGGSTEETQTVSVEGESSSQVSFRRSFASAGEYSVQVSGSETATVTVEQPASFSVTDFSVEGGDLVAGDSVGVTATVENSGDREGTFEAKLQIDGETVTSEPITVSGGESSTVSFDRTLEEAGSYSIQISGSERKTVTVDQPATFDVSDLSLSDSVILEGDSVTVTGTVTNVGDRSGDYDVELITNGQILQSEPVQLAPDESATVSFTETFDSPGEYDISMSGTLDGADLQVDQPATFQIDDATVNRSETIVLSPVGVEVTVSNVGDREGNYTIGLATEDDVVAGREITVAGSSTEVVTLTQRFSDIGEYDLTVNGTGAGTVVIGERPAFEIRNISIPADLVAPGEQTTVEFVAENPSNLTVTRSINVTAGDEPVGAQIVTLDAGERREMAVDFEAANGTVTVEGRAAGSVELIQESQEESTGTDESESTSSVPIMLSILLLVVLGGAGGTYYAIQRRESDRV